MTSRHHWVKDLAAHKSSDDRAAPNLAFLQAIDFFYMFKHTAYLLITHNYCCFAITQPMNRQMLNLATK